MPYLLTLPGAATLLARPAGLRQWLTAAGFLVGGLLLGLLASRVVRRLHARGTLNRWPSIRAAQDLVIVACTAEGLDAAIYALPLRRAAATAAHKLVAVTLLLCVTVFCARMAAKAVQHFAHRAEGSAMFGSILLNVARLIVFAFGLLVILQTVGVSITPMLTALGVGGLAVALALQPTLTNLVSGIHLIASRYVRGGDYVRMDSGEEGYVVDINWRHTTLRQLPDNLILIPNARLAQAILTNYHEPERGLKITVDLGVSYDSDLEHVERVTLEVGREVMRDVSGGDPDYEPVVRFNGFGDSSISLTVCLRAAEFSLQYPVRHAFVKRLHARFRQEGIEIPFPTRTLRWEALAAPPLILDRLDERPDGRRRADASDSQIVLP